MHLQTFVYIVKTASITASATSYTFRPRHGVTRGHARAGQRAVSKGSQILCDLSYTTGLPPAGIFNSSRSAMLRAWAAFQHTGGQKRVRMLVSFCVVHMADAVIEAVKTLVIDTLRN